MKNIVFDLGGVVVSRDRNLCGEEFASFFAFVCTDPLPDYWTEYDRGTKTREEVEVIMAGIKGCSLDRCRWAIDQAISLQAPIAPTERLIRDLKSYGYRLYVLSNMSYEFIEYIRRFDVYGNFDGEVISCEEKVVKPEPAIYECLLSRYSLDPSETLFIDDRAANLRAAEEFGLSTFHFREPREESCASLRRMLLDGKR